MSLGELLASCALTDILHCLVLDFFDHLNDGIDGQTLLALDSVANASLARCPSLYVQLNGRSSMNSLVFSALNGKPDRYR